MAISEGKRFHPRRAQSEVIQQVKLLTEAERRARGEEIMARFSTPRSGEASSRDTYGIEERCRSEWASSPELRAEFGELERYIAFAKADARRLVRIISRKA